MKSHANECYRSMSIPVGVKTNTLIKHRLRDAFGSGVDQSYATVGEPVSLPDAEKLAQDDPYQFQWWALGLVGARPVEQKKGYPRRGIDGRIDFHDKD